ncbi:MAG: VOC family protein [Rhizobiaceae bacterium]|nr:VOC family protein [Rhizobiaceae bacterium]
MSDQVESEHKVSDQNGVQGAHVGHGHLMVADIERAIAFYQDVIGMRLMLRYGSQAAFMSFDDYHHHLGLNTWESKNGSPPPKGHTGLYHIAFVFPDRASLGQVIDRVQSAGYELIGASDHGVSEAVYLNDPDGNGLELYRDRPREEWKMTADGVPELVNRPLDVAALVEEGRVVA